MVDIIGIKRDTPVNSPHCALFLFFAKTNEASSQKIFCYFTPGACDKKADDAQPVEVDTRSILGHEHSPPNFVKQCQKRKEPYEINESKTLIQLLVSKTHLL